MRRETATLLNYGWRRICRGVKKGYWQHPLRMGEHTTCEAMALELEARTEVGELSNAKTIREKFVARLV